MEPEFEPPARRRSAFASLVQAAATGFRVEESDILTLSEPSLRALKKASRTEETHSSRSLLELSLSEAPRKRENVSAVGVGGRPGALDRKWASFQPNLA